jgi:hypothetical protein
MKKVIGDMKETGYLGEPEEPVANLLPVPGLQN